LSSCRRWRIVSSHPRNQPFFPVANNRVAELTDPAGINVTDWCGITALHIAASEGRLEIVQWLIENHGNMKARDNKNMTILHRAVESGNFELVKWLVVEQKVDVNATDTYRDTAWDKAAERGNLELLKWYIDRTLSPVDLQSLLLRAAKTSEFKYHSGCYDVIKWLVEEKDVHTGPGWTLLQLAVHVSNYEVVKWLIDSRRVSGVEVNELLLRDLL
jgi:hypothetical protein